MTARERVLACRLIQKIDNNESFAKQIDLSYTLSAAGAKKSNIKPVQKKQLIYKENDS